MNVSPKEKVRGLYDDSADSYAEMMDSEIELPVYADTLGRLAGRIAAVAGPVLDTSCGPGHVLALYREGHDRNRPLMGIDLSPRMVELAHSRLGSEGAVTVGDMRDLKSVATGTVAAILSFFAVHHLDPVGIAVALREWHRVLRPGGQLIVGAWEGSGPIDYGGAADIVALRYRLEELGAWSAAAGFVITRCVVEPVEGMLMDAVYLEGTKEQRHIKATPADDDARLRLRIGAAE